MNHFRPAVLAVVLLLPAASRLAAAESEEIRVAAEWKSMDVKDNGTVVFEPARAEVEFVAEKPEALKTLPEGLIDASFGRRQIGDRTVVFALAKSKAEAPGRDVLYADLDGNGEFDPGENFDVDLSLRGGASQGSVLDGLRAGTAGRPLTFIFVCAEGPGRPLAAQVIATYYAEAKVVGDGKECVLRLRDADLDGAFSGEQDGWILADAGPVARPVPEYGVNALGEGIFRDGAVLRVAEVGADLAVRLTATPAAGPDPGDLAKARERVERTWFARFEAEKADFVKARGMDASRPLAEKPIDWKWVTFEQAQAMAKEQGKALFVDVMAFWCVWCWRMDYYTYPDKEVADLVNEKFVAVKIIEEQDAAGEYARVRDLIGGEGIPAMGVFGSDGALVHRIGGWNKPEDFLRELRTALEKPGK